MLSHLNRGGGQTHKETEIETGIAIFRLNLISEKWDKTVVVSKLSTFTTTWATLPPSWCTIYQNDFQDHKRMKHYLTRITFFLIYLIFHFLKPIRFFVAIGLCSCTKVLPIWFSSNFQKCLQNKFTKWFIVFPEKGNVLSRLHCKRKEQLM